MCIVNFKSIFHFHKLINFTLGLQPGFSNGEGQIEWFKKKLGCHRQNVGHGGLNPHPPGEMILIPFNCLHSLKLNHFYVNLSFWPCWSQCADKRDTDWLSTSIGRVRNWIMENMELFWGHTWWGKSGPWKEWWGTTCGEGVRAPPIWSSHPLGVWFFLLFPAWSFAWIEIFLSAWCLLFLLGIS